MLTYGPFQTKQNINKKKTIIIIGVKKKLEHEEKNIQ